MSVVELDQWQDPSDGFPADAYQDAVIVALEEAGIGVDDAFRDDRHEFVITIGKGVLAGTEFAGYRDLAVVWSVDPDSEPLGEQGLFTCGTGPGPGWFWMPCVKGGHGENPEELCTPGTKDQIDPFAEPAEVAAAVAALVRDGSDQEAAKVICRDCGLPANDGPGRRDTRHDHCGPLPHTGPVGGPYCERCG